MPGERRRLGLIVMAGAVEAPGPAVCLVQEARLAAALDTLAAAELTGLFDVLIVATNNRALAAELPAQVRVDLDPPGSEFRFGHRLAGLIDRYQLTHALYVGAGAAPLIGAQEIDLIVRSALDAERLVVTNNLHSTDWAAFAPAAAIKGYEDRIERDNSLAWVLHREGGLEVESWPVSAASRLDIDTPTDLAVLALHPGCGPRLAATLSGQGLNTDKLERARRILAKEGSHVMVGGRAGSAVWRALEERTLCWVRLIAEERGMVASGRQMRGEVRSLLGAYLDEVGMDRFFQSLESWSDAVFLDNRVILAHEGLWPPAEDRFASDLGWVEGIEDPFLAEFTRHAAVASVPIVLGGHSLVSGGLLALVETLPNGAS
jgi:2-phospho-L-lactate guanylyltransferase (CobY/MobA/RfbA family)